MKKYWKNILLYGFSLGLLLAALQTFQYKWTMAKSAVDLYSGLIALLFTVLGIWAGIQLTRNRSTPVRVPIVESFQPSEVVINQLGLTPRELEVLRLMAKGHSNQEIADALFVSLNTIKTHISNLLSKLDAERRTQAIQKAKSLGLLA